MNRYFNKTLIFNKLQLIYLYKEKNQYKYKSANSFIA